MSKDFEIISSTTVAQRSLWRQPKGCHAERSEASASGLTFGEKSRFLAALGMTPSKSSRDARNVRISSMERKDERFSAALREFWNLVRAYERKPHS